MFDCPILLAYVNADDDIFGKDKDYLYSKNVGQKTYQSQSKYINTPRNLMEEYQLFTLSSHFMFVNGIQFFITIGYHIKVITTLMAKYQHTKP